MIPKVPLLIAVVVALNACDGTDTRAKRLAAIDEVERSCHLPKGTIDRVAANEPAVDDQACDPVKKQCNPRKFIHLGDANFDPLLLCRFSCVKNYQSQNGYEFGLYVHSFSSSDDPQTDNCQSRS